MDIPYGIWVLYILRILSERTCRQLEIVDADGEADDKYAKRSD